MKKGSGFTTKLISIVASVALVVGLVPLPAFAEAGEAAEGLAPGAETVQEPAAASGELAMTADGSATEESVDPEATDGSDDEAADGLAAGNGPAVEDGSADADEPTVADEPAVEDGAADADEPAAEDGSAVADEPAAEDWAADADEPTVELQPVGAAETDWEPEDASDAEDGATPEMTPETEPVLGDEPEQDPDSEAAAADYPAFSQSATVDDVEITVEAEPGVFPEDARLSVESVPSSVAEDAVAPEREKGANVAKSYTFDIKVLGANGDELQPADGKSVEVAFRAAEVADPNLDAHVYHVPEGADEADELAVSASDDTATAVSDGFSYYTVEFTYNELQYVLPGGQSVALSAILDAVGLVGEPTAAVSSAPDLFTVEELDGVWAVAAREAFSSTETLTVTLNGMEYEISVTDDDSGSSSDYGIINGIPASNGNYVWMGGGESPFKWHIIGEDSSHYLLISADVVGGAMSWDDALVYSEEEVFPAFTLVEQAAVPVTEKSEPADYDRFYDFNHYGPSSVNSHLFLLSIDEAETYFDSGVARTPGNWWLRMSVMKTDKWAACVGYSGEISSDVKDRSDNIEGNIFGPRPVFQLNRASVLLESAAEGGKSSATTGAGEFGVVSAPSGSEGNEVKLTLVDSSRTGFSANASSNTIAAGGALTVSYGGARTGENEYVSAAICDASGSAVYYASLTPEATGSGTWNMTIPEGLAGGRYTLKLFSEQQNGDKKTDYASEPVSIALKVTGEPVTVTYKVVNGTWENGTTVDQTESVLCGYSPVSVPTGMTAFPGYVGGEWDEDPSTAIIAKDTTFTFAYHFDNMVNEIPPAIGGYIWMGGDGPVKWRIIGQDSGRYLLISANGLGGGMTWQNAMSYGGTVFSGFTAVEQVAVPVTSKSEPQDYQYISQNGTQFGRSTVNGNLFLLSAEEVETYLDSDDARRPGAWWLRSPSSSDNRAGIVDSSLRLGLFNQYSTSMGPRLAFQLKRESILLESAAEGGKSSADAGAGEFGSFRDGSVTNGLAERKLTLIDSSRSGFSASASSAMVVAGEALDVSYEGVTSGDYVSAAICDASGAILYYASLTPDGSGSGTWEMAIPADLTWGKYTLKVFSEQQNGNQKTDYASEPTSIELTVTGEPVAVTYRVVNGTWEDGTAADRVENVPGGLSPASVPTGMVASPGHTGGAWDTDPAGAIIDKETTFTYTFEAIPYTVKFVNDDGTVLQSSEMTYGTMPKYTGKTPTKASTADYRFTFKGWTPAISEVTKAVTYKATFNKIAKPSYTVKFVNDDGTVLQSSEMTEGATPKYTGKTPTKASTADYRFTFKGWTPAISAVTKAITYKATFNKIAKPSIAKAKVKLAKTKYAYNGKAKKPAVKSVVLNGKTLKAGTDYTVKYANNKKVGTASATVTGKGNYKGSAKATFKIVLRKAKTPTVAGKSTTSVKVSWKKVKGAKKYRLQYRQAGGKWKAKTVKGASKTVKGLKADKLYQFRVRAVAGKQKGAWSTVAKHRL